MDVASGADRNLDITYVSDCRWSKSHLLLPHFLEKCLAVPRSPFFHLLLILSFMIWMSNFVLLIINDNTYK